MTAASIDWEAVYREYETKIHSYIRGKVGNPADVDDLCSEVFLNIMRSKDQFSGEQRALSSWIYVTTKNVVALYYRKQKNFVVIPETTAADLDIEKQVLDAELLDSLADALENLETRLRDIILLHYYGGKTLKEIAAAMKMSYPNIKILHRKALRQLKEQMGYYY